MTEEELDGIIASQTLGDGGPLTRACFDDLHRNCELQTNTGGICNCACHRHPYGW